MDGALSNKIGERVFVRHDEENLGAIHLFEADETTFICTATSLDLDGVDRATIARRAKADFTRAIKSYARRDNANKGRLGSAESMWKAIAGEGDASQKIVPLKNGKEVLVARTNKATGFNEAMFRKNEIERGQRLKRAADLIAVIEGGGILSPNEEGWLSSYQPSPEYRTYFPTFQQKVANVG